MEQFLLVLSPAVVAGITEVIKWVRARVSVGEFGRITLRFIVALLALISSVLIALSTGAEIGQETIEVFVEALFTFLGATGIYFLRPRD